MDTATSVNKYRCTRCGKHTFTFNVVDGTTPFMIGCGQCGGNAHSQFYKLNDLEKSVTPTREFRMPTDVEFRAYGPDMEQEMREHCKRGALVDMPIAEGTVRKWQALRAAATATPDRFVCQECNGTGSVPDGFKPWGSPQFRLCACMKPAPVPTILSTLTALSVRGMAVTIFNNAGPSIQFRVSKHPDKPARFFSVSYRSTSDPGMEAELCKQLNRMADSLEKEQE